MLSKSLNLIKTFHLKDLVLLSLGVVLLILSSHLKIILPFSPVPITLQTLVVFLMAFFLSFPLAPLSVGIYILGGGLGLPYFAGPSQMGFSYLIGPTGGYLLGFLAASYLINKFKTNSLIKNGLLLVANNGLIYVLGTLQLSIWLNWFGSKGYSFEQIMLMAVIPFIPGDLVKIFLALTGYHLYLKSYGYKK